MDSQARRAGNAVAAYPLFQADGGGAIPTPALSASEIRIDEIGARLACELNRQWHSMLPRTDLGNILCGNMTICFGAMHDERWYAVAIYSQPIIASLCNGSTLELRRLAICKDAPKNLASRMLAICSRIIRKKMPHIRKLVSYLAVDVHKGTIYKAAGWKAVGEVVAARPQRFSNINSETRATGPLQTKSRKQRWEICL